MIGMGNPHRLAMQKDLPVYTVMMKHAAVYEGGKLLCYQCGKRVPWVYDTELTLGDPTGTLTEPRVTLVNYVCGKCHEVVRKALRRLMREGDTHA